MGTWVWSQEGWRLGFGGRGLDFVGRFGVKCGERGLDLDRDRDWVRGSTRLDLMVLGLTL